MKNDGTTKRISKVRFTELFSTDKVKGKNNKNDLVENKKSNLFL